MIRSDHLLATTLAFWVFVRERCLHEIVAGISISVAITFIPTIVGLISLFLFLERGVPLEFLESRLRSLICWFIRFPWSIGLSLLFGIITALQCLGVFTQMGWSLLWINTLVTRSIRVTNVLALPMKIFPLLIKFFAWCDNHVWSRILHWLVRAHRVRSMIHTLVIWMHWHLHEVLLIWIWRTMLSHEWWVALHDHMLRSVMRVHSEVRMTWRSVSWWSLVVCKVSMFWHFHLLTRMIWHLAVMTVGDLHVWMLDRHGLWMHDLLMSLARVLCLDTWLLDTFFRINLLFTLRFLFSIVSAASLLLLRVWLALLLKLLLLLLLMLLLH